MRKVVITNLAITLLLVAILDIAAYFLLPQRYTLSLPGYRREFRVVDRLLIGAPRWYYVADSVSGFELGSNAKSQYILEGKLHHVWSNSIGCFDREHLEDSSFVYFTGDSFAWGFVPYEKNFGTRVEALTSMPIYKCGITHSGQRHQLKKLADIVEHRGAVPTAVFVFHFDNDIANDYAYPHSTVMDGWLVDAVVAGRDHALIHRSATEISNGIGARIQAAAIQQRGDSIAFSDPLYRFMRKFAQYSLTKNVVGAMEDKLAGRSPAPWPPGSKWLPISGGSSPTQPGESPQFPFYSTPTELNDRYWYTTNPYAHANKQALLAFKSWCAAHGVSLVVILIPKNVGSFRPQYKSELHSFLRSNGIRFMDLAGVLSERNLHPGDLYLREDPHFNANGNAMVARALLDSFPQYFEQQVPHSTNASAQ